MSTSIYGKFILFALACFLSYNAFLQHGDVFQFIGGVVLVYLIAYIGAMIELAKIEEKEDK